MVEFSTKWRFLTGNWKHLYTESAAGSSIEEQLLSASSIEIAVTKNDSVVMSAKLL